MKAGDLFNFKGQAQVREICNLLLTKAKVVNFSGSHCKVAGKKFHMKHLYLAKAILRIIRKQKREDAKTLPENITMIDLVNRLFLGM